MSTDAPVTSRTPEDRDLGQLMQAAQTGDADAYLALLRSVTPRIRRTIARQRGFVGPEAVEDLVQDVLLSLHTVRATYDPSRPFMPWLLAIVRHRLADGARRHARAAAREVHLDELDVTFSTAQANSVEGTFQHADTVRRALGALPAGQRQAIELVKLRGLSHKEAAAVSGTSVGALKVATHRAMGALRRILGGTPEQK
jgi:RNA polymerase sigma-70 factor (ECF subfamily)